MGSTISMQNVTWRRNGKEILKDINWEVKDDEHWGILGLNGSGKTSLLNIVTGYQYPTKGKVSILGNEFGKTNIPQLRKRIGYVSSSLGKFSHSFEKERTEAIIVSGKFASFGLYEEVIPEDWDKADELISSFRLEHVKGKTYGNLSQGEQRKVLIARALMSEPDILILDEPCSGLDVLSREDVLELMGEMNRRGCRLLYVTHHIEEIIQVISHVLLIRNGEIVAAGPKKQILNDELLSETFNIPVHVRWEDNRPWLSLPKVAARTIK